jgi:isochorismate synthase
MDETSNRDYSHFDALIAQDCIFAAYRIPGSEIMNLLVQESDFLSCYKKISSLNGKKGFVISPFIVDRNKPVVLLRPDIMLEGEKDIFNYIEENFKNKDFFSGISERNYLQEKANDFDRYKKTFSSFQSALKKNKCDKVVLSRKIQRKIPDNFSPGKIFHLALNTYPEAFVCLFNSPKTGTWIISSPEKILSRNGDKWQTVALAGTMYAKDKTENIIWDKKNINEQEIVSSYIERLLIENNIQYSRNGPFNSNAGNLKHLKTEFNFTMSDENKVGNILELLHPTPAVCGYPKKSALKLIKKSEGYDRRYYTGFSGPLSITGETNLFVNLRCMEITPDSLNLYAGGGLLPSSELMSEWDETEAKLQTMLSLFES